jgi:hypothetical protein
MDRTHDSEVVAGPAPGRSGRTHRTRGLAVTGLLPRQTWRG